MMWARGSAKSSQSFPCVVVSPEAGTPPSFQATQPAPHCCEEGGLRAVGACSPGTQGGGRDNGRGRAGSISCAGLWVWPW